MQGMNSSIFNSETGKVLLRIVLPYLAIMGVFCLAFDGWFADQFIFSVEDEGPAKVQRYLTVHDPGEVPVFGNSRTNNAIDPTLIAPRSWNYGINGSDSEWLRYLLENELASDRKTPIVIGIDPQFFFINQFGDALDYVPLSDHESIWRFLQKQGRDEAYFRLPTIRFYGAFERFLHRYLIKNVGSSSYCKPSNGASLCDAQLDPEAVPPRTDPTQMDPSNYANGAWLWATCKQHPERCFVFAELPFYDRKFLADEVRNPFDFFRGLIRSLPNTTWVAMPYGAMQINHFQNFTHLNTAGAQWYTQHLRHEMDRLPNCGAPR
jgi:hypothetical protein